MSGKFGNFAGSGNPLGAPKTQPQLNITPEDMKTLACEYCDCRVFAEGLVIKTVSPLLTQNGKEGMLPIPAFWCVRCHQPVQKYLPEEVRDKPIISAK